MKFTAWRHPAFRERLKEQNLDRSDPSKGRGRPLLRHQERQGLVATRHPPESGRRRHAQERSPGAANLHAPERPARPNQRGQELQHDARRGAGQSHLVHVHARGDAAGRLALRRRRRQRRDALRQQANGGPIFVYVKDGKIIRTTPIEFDDEDAPSWSIKARGKTLHAAAQDDARRRTACARSRMVYSQDRLLYPMKRVDFDPNGERNTQNRGKSGIRAHQLGRGARHRRRARSSAPRRVRAPARSRAATARTTSGATSATTSARFNRFWNPVGVHQAGAQPRQLGRLVLGRRCTTGATACGSARRSPTAPSRTASRKPR